jgi:hypothetical protein
MNQAKANEQLDEAVRTGDIKGARAAIASGADAHITGSLVVEANDVLNQAAESGNFEMVKLLLESGAQPCNFDTRNIEAAVVLNNPAMVAAFLKHCRYEHHVYVDLIETATREGFDKVGNLLAKVCANREAVEEFMAWKKDRRLKMRAENAVAKARKELESAIKSRSPRQWQVALDGIYIKGPWDAVLGRRLRELGAKWDRGGWWVSHRRAKQVAALINDYPRLEAERLASLQQTQEIFAGVALPRGYKVVPRDWHMEVSGRGNAQLDAALNTILGEGSRFQSQAKHWPIPGDKTPAVAEAFRQHLPPLPPPPPPPAPKLPPIIIEQAQNAMRNSRMPAGYSCQACSEGIRIKGPYLEGLDLELRALKGTWDPKAQDWTVRLEMVCQLVGALSRFAPDPATVAKAKSTLAAVVMPEGYGCEVPEDGIYVSVPDDGLTLKIKELGARWNKESGSWYVAPERAEALADRLRQISDQAAHAKEILAEAPLRKGYTCEVALSYIRVSGPKDEGLRKQFKNLGGRWNPEGMYWWFSLTRAPQLAQVLRSRVSG